ncbi:MAG TPA: DNA polymerase III subunit chi [Alphaproteobacteria bacterium]|nr:DNA polymerase III subunit chi [Alphaproteobacteria bacterium]
MLKVYLKIDFSPSHEYKLTMTEIGFYHLTTSPLERALPRLLEKVLEAHKRAVIMFASQERLEYINSALWTLGKASFIPHGSAKEGFAEDHPIWLTTEDENPNGAHFLFLTDGIESPSLSTYERCLDLFDGNDEEAVAQARERWLKAKDQNHKITYWKQTKSGAWEKGA